MLRGHSGTLAHRGVLFLDELCEFRRDTLEALRGPLETGWASIVRVGSSSELPCRFMLVAASNPCPCGRGEADPECSCAPLAVNRYHGRLSGALADRIDVLVAMRQPSAKEIAGEPGEPSGIVRERVSAARRRQEERLGPGRCNAEMTPSEARASEVEDAAAKLLAESYARRGLSGRAHDRVLRLARSVADLAGSEQITRDQMAEALQLRRREPVSSPRACGACLRRSWLLARLAAHIERIATGAPGRRSPELLRLSNEDLAAVAAPSSADRILQEVGAIPERNLRADLLAAQCWACCRHDRLFPSGLRDAPDAPWVLIGRGNAAALERLEPEGAVTVVGSRRASSYGREVARSLGRELAAAGLAVVSGLAFGIDACAHRGALEGGLTVAVLGCGADVAYPAAHRSLWRRICESGMALSELPPGVGAWRWAFPARNRIMAALAAMTVVVEAAERSGSLITADLAADLGRDLGAVPGPVGSRFSAGPNNLLAGGACLVRDAQDVLDTMLGPGAPRLERRGPALGERLREVLEAVERGADTCDAVAGELELSGAEAATALAHLEALGYVGCSLLGVYTRTQLPAAHL